MDIDQYCRGIIRERASPRKVARVLNALVDDVVKECRGIGADEKTVKTVEKISFDVEVVSGVDMLSPIKSLDTLHQVLFRSVCDWGLSAPVEKKDRVREQRLTKACWDIKVKIPKVIADLAVWRKSYTLIIANKKVKSRVHLKVIWGTKKPVLPGTIVSPEGVRARIGEALACMMLENPLPAYFLGDAFTLNLDLVIEEELNKRGSVAGAVGTIIRNVKLPFIHTNHQRMLILANVVLSAPVEEISCYIAHELAHLFDHDVNLPQQSDDWYRKLMLIRGEGLARFLECISRPERFINAELMKAHEKCRSSGSIVQGGFDEYKIGLMLFLELFIFIVYQKKGVVITMDQGSLVDAVVHHNHLAVRLYRVCNRLKANEFYKYYDRQYKRFPKVSATLAFIK